MTDPAQIAKSLSEAERARLVGWPHCKGLLFWDGTKPDAVAQSLVDKGICNFMPWKNGNQLGLSATGLAVRAILEETP